jgi:FlaA1/EpsC-like NDP-sugar epimerase
MGDPVKIVQLANDLIELHGLKRGEDVEITFTGLRPGEKLTEELLFPYERSEATSHEAVRRIVHGIEPPASLDDATAELRRLVDLRQRTAILEQMRQIVPEYVPAAVRR